MIRFYPVMWSDDTQPWMLNGFEFPTRKINSRLCCLPESLSIFIETLFGMACPQ